MATDFQVKDYNFEQCMKCSVCTAYCPVTLVNPKFPGPKQSGPDGERYRLKDIKYFDKTLDLCLNCKRCEVACPSDVKIADIIQVVRFKHATRPPSLRNRLMAETDLVGSIASKATRLVNSAFANRHVKNVLDAIFEIDRRRTLPRYAPKTFKKLFEKHYEQQQQQFDRKVAYFYGCHVNYIDPQLGIDLVKILNAVGIGVIAVDEKCCGMPLIMNGLVDRAKRNAEYNIASIRKLVDRSLPILTTSSTCTLTLRAEYNHILGLDNEDIRDSIFLATRYLYDLIDNGTIKPVFKPDAGKKVAYHTSCHMEKLGWAIYSSKLLALIPGSKTIVMESSCCGLAGTYGYKKENYDDSQKIGKDLFKRIAKLEPDCVASDCESCNKQISESTPYTALNPISIIAGALDFEATRRANMPAD